MKHLPNTLFKALLVFTNPITRRTHLLPSSYNKNPPPPEAAPPSTDTDRAFMIMDLVIGDDDLSIVDGGSRMLSWLLTATLCMFKWTRLLS
ncbi:hypothetical protein L1987_54208 [Smallanthus sonchifolius]|uniref:Uncharacterized protein n=1 Tax=Smallanthus sonchifolius TaxID=185202 RepID=A0ACB9E6E1_9ASTR|nr:hypothetical protein L1987_54208 [Smallanthus sonchifolius]